jgi:pimeloyl-ACP methyl ester carboxylesterase
MRQAIGRAATVAAVFLAFAATAAAQSGPLRTEPFTLRSYDGRERPAERLRLTVPADGRDGRDGRTIDLAFLRLRPAGTATRPPLVFLMGGPGVPASVMAPIPPYFTLFTRLAEGGDVILLDQRGLGESTPVSDCPAATVPLPADLFDTPDTLIAAFAASYRTCVAALAPRLRPTDLTVERVAGDIQAIRVALGVPQVDLLAFSFGSRIALDVMQRHPQRVRKVVLQGVLGVDTLRLPSLDDAVFTRFAAIADAQAAAKGLAPSAAAAVRTIQQRAARVPLSVLIQTVGGVPRQIRVGRATFDALVLSRLGDPGMQAMLTAAAGGDDSLLTPWVQSLYQDLEKGAGSLMARAMVCSTASGPATRRQAAREATATLLGEALDNRMQGGAFCQAVGVTPPASQAAVKARVPALLISGTLDPRTPPDRAEVTRRGLAGSKHVIVQNGGHELLPVPEVQDLVVSFLDGKPERKPIVLPPPEVRTIEEARRPPRPRR